MWTIPVAAGITVLDQQLKTFIEKQKKPFFPHALGKGAVTLERLHNPGFALQKGQEHPENVTRIVTLFFAAFVLRWASRIKIPGAAHSSNLQNAAHLGQALVVGGAASNWIDRIRRGYVVDYLRFSPGPVRKLVMNVGDLAIFAGAALVLAGELTPEE